MTTQLDPNTDLRERLLTQTTRVVRRRRYLRRVRIAVACAGCYLAGLGTIWLLGDGAAAATPTVASAPPERVKPKSPVPSAKTMQKRPRKTELAQTRKPLQKRPKKTRFESLRDLGDLYLEREGDPAGATRCYQMALRYATPQELNHNTDEGTWLFRALKLDQAGDNHAAQNQG